MSDVIVRCSRCKGPASFSIEQSREVKIVYPWWSRIPTDVECGPISTTAFYSCLACGNVDPIQPALTQEAHP